MEVLCVEALSTQEVLLAKIDSVDDHILFQFPEKLNSCVFSKM